MCRAKCEGRALSMGRLLLVQQGQVGNIQAVVEEAKNIRMQKW